MDATEDVPGESDENAVEVEHKGKKASGKKKGKKR